MLNIMLPAAGYDDEPGRRYPVIYLLDGGQHEDFTHMAWRRAVRQFRWVQRLPPSILVGISNTDRKRDMTFKASPGFVWPKWMHAYTAAYKNAGGSETFMRHIEAEVQPFVEREFRTNGDRMLVGRWPRSLPPRCCWKKPQLFNRYVIMSPACGGTTSRCSGRCRGVKQWPRTPRQVWAVGHEGPEMERHQSPGPHHPGQQAFRHGAEVRVLARRRPRHHLASGHAAGFPVDESPSCPALRNAGDLATRFGLAADIHPVPSLAGQGAARGHPFEGLFAPGHAGSPGPARPAGHRHRLGRPWPRVTKSGARKCCAC